MSKDLGRIKAKSKWNSMHKGPPALKRMAAKIARRFGLKWAIKDAQAETGRHDKIK